MEKSKRKKDGRLENRKWEPTQKSLEELEACLDRMTSSGDREYFRGLLMDMMRNNAFPEDLLGQVPVPAREVDKTRFDQLYDAASFLAFPGYTEGVLEMLLGPGGEPGTKVWRVMLPAKFGIRHCLIRASSFQEAFGLGCDYACRMSLRLFRKIPVDLTVRIQFVSDRALRRILSVRWRNRILKRDQLKVEGRTFTTREVQGAALLALGRGGTAGYRLAWYSERKDLVSLRKAKDMVKCSVVEYESMKSKKKQG